MADGSAPKNGLFVLSDGTKEWYKDGKLHRDDGPALEQVIVPGKPWVDKYWYQNGEFHRDDGPAVECDDGSKTWYRHGVLHREDGPAHIYPNGGEEWYQDGEKHRVGGPACIYPGLRKSWWYKGQFHREDGPAVVEDTGEESWYWHGRPMTPEEIAAAKERIEADRKKQIANDVDDAMNRGMDHKIPVKPPLKLRPPRPPKP